MFFFCFFCIHVHRPSVLLESQQKIKAAGRRSLLHSGFFFFRLRSRLVGWSRHVVCRPFQTSLRLRQMVGSTRGSWHVSRPRSKSVRSLSRVCWVGVATMRTYSTIKRGCTYFSVTDVVKRVFFWCTRSGVWLDPYSPRKSQPAFDFFR